MAAAGSLKARPELNTARPERPEENAALLDCELLSDMFLRLFRHAGDYGPPQTFPLLEFIRPPNDQADIVEICGTIGSGKTTILYSIIASVLVATEPSSTRAAPADTKPGIRSAIKSPDCVAWFDCDCNLRANDAIAVVLARLAVHAPAPTSDSTSTPSAEALLNRAKACLRRVITVRPKNLVELSVSLEAWCTGIGTGEKAKPALVILDGLWGFIWMHTRSSNEHVDNIVRNLRGIAERGVRIVWTRQLLFKLDNLPFSIRTPHVTERDKVRQALITRGMLMHGELAVGLQQARDVGVQRMAAADTYRVLAGANGLLQVPALSPPNLHIHLTPNGNGFGGDDATRLPVWPSPWQLAPGTSYTDVLGILGDKSTPIGLRRITRGTMITTRLPRCPTGDAGPLQAGPMVGPEGVTLHVQDFCVRWVGERADTEKVVREWQVKEEEGGAAGSERQPVPLIWECGIACVAADVEPRAQPRHLRPPPQVQTGLGQLQSAGSKPEAA